MLTELGLGRGTRTHLFHADAPVAAGVLGEILDVTTVSRASDSCLTPALMIANLLTTRTGGELAGEITAGIAVATGSGQLALARVTPAHHEEVTTC